MKKISLALIMAAPLALGGIAIAQTTPTVETPNAQTSTPGAGCTATGNAMRAGNLGGGPSSAACATQASANTAAAAPATTATTASGNSTSAAGSTGTRNSDAMASSEPTRVARAPRADRN
jgi:hypothetical protein